MVPPTRIELVMTGYQPIVIPFNYRGIIWNTGWDSNPRLYGFAIRYIGRSVTCAYIGVPSGTRTPTDSFGDCNAAITLRIHNW